MTRENQWARLARTAVFDLAVIGGGATGLGVALDAVLRGFSVVLLESHDFGGGTSSRSTKLLHGGVRYLAQGNIALVREALAERANVLHIAPHLAQPLPFVMPSYRWWQTPFYGMGLKLYDLLAGRAGLGQTQWLTPQQTRTALPGLRPQGLRGGVKYWDGQFDDARLALSLARSVERAGGLPMNYAAVTGLSAPSSGAPAGLFTLEVQDRVSRHGRTTVRARAVVNAAGVWVDEVRQKAVPNGAEAPHRLVSPSQGVHIVVDRAFMPSDHALLVPRTDDGRVLFAVPWMGALILGTTDTPRQDLPREPRAFEDELAFILREAGQYLARPLQRTDIRSLWVGLRPLVATSPGRKGTKSLSREHVIVTDDHGLITVTGGKWTTYRAMAEEVLDTCFMAGVLPYRGGGLTRTHTLVGAPGPGTATASITGAPGAHLFGNEWAQVKACPGASRALGMGLTEAMVRYAARSEYARTVEDVLARRWRALFLDARQAMAMAPAVAQLLQEETRHDPRLQPFLSLAASYLPGPLPENQP